MPGPFPVVPFLIDILERKLHSPEHAHAVKGHRTALRTDDADLKALHRGRLVWPAYLRMRPHKRLNLPETDDERKNNRLFTHELSPPFLYFRKARNPTGDSIRPEYKREILLSRSMCCVYLCGRLMQ